MIGGTRIAIPEQIGTFYASATALAANAVETVLAPASNVNGVIIHAASIVIYGGSAAVVEMLYAKSSAPTAIGQSGVLLGVASETGKWGNTILPDELFIPPGLGIYFFSGAAQTYGRRSICYTVK